jgi:hypothetical protein
MPKGEYSVDVLSAPGCYARSQGVWKWGGSRCDLQDIEQDRATAVVFWQQEDRGGVKMKVSETLEHRFPSKPIVIK